MDCGYQNRAKLAPKWDQKSMLTPKGVFSKNNSFPNEKLGFFRSKASKLRAKTDQKIDQKMESKMECILASILERFWSILGAKLGWKIDQKSIKNGIEKTIEKRRASRRAYEVAVPGRPEPRERG